MDDKVIRRNSIFYLLVLLCLWLAPNAAASTNQFDSRSVGLNNIQDIKSDFYALMSQEARNASDLKIVIRENWSRRSIYVDPSVDWRDIDWKDPFAPKIDVLKREASDVTITLEQSMPPASSEIDSISDLIDPFAPRKEAPELSDPFEEYNRFMFEFNEGVYQNVIEPVAEGYRDLINDDIRMAISNIFSNSLAPVKLVSSILQGDLGKTSRVIGRTIINTTIGIGGMFDVAEGFGIESVNEDLDQALASHGVPTGPYIVLPLLGPSTIRGIVGTAGGSFLSPTFHFAPGVEVGAGITLTDKINDASFILDDKKQLEESTIDEYESIKDFYNQYRFGLVNE